MTERVKNQTRFDERYENDPTPSREIARRYRQGIHDDDHDVSLATVHYRGGEEEFSLGMNYSRSDDPGDRATGADILAQLGWSDHAYQDESVAILIDLLSDPDPYVIYCAAVGLGHRSAASSIPELLKLTKHPDPVVRYGVVFGLLGHEDDRAIDALIEFSRDEDRDVRNWAVFGIGTQIERDSLEIRDALGQALGDPDQEIRGEALVGLAKRGDPAIVPEILNEWRNDDVSLLSIEAAEETRDPRLFNRLNRFREILNFDEDPHFKKQLERAIEACRPGADGAGQPATRSQSK